MSATIAAVPAAASPRLAPRGRGARAGGSSIRVLAIIIGALFLLPIILFKVSSAPWPRRPLPALRIFHARSPGRTGTPAGPGRPRRAAAHSLIVAFGTALLAIAIAAPAAYVISRLPRG